MDSDYGNYLTNSHIPVSFRADLARFWKLPHVDDDDTSIPSNYKRTQIAFVRSNFWPVPAQPGHDKA